jgi:hypothetical protein
MTDEELIKRRDAVAVLVKAQIASCTCQVKTPDPDWHLHNCRYRILRDAEAMIEHVPSVATMPTGTDTTTWNAAIRAAADAMLPTIIDFRGSLYEPALNAAMGRILALLKP